MLPGTRNREGTVVMQHRHRFGRRALRLAAAAVVALAVAPLQAAAPAAPAWVEEGESGLAERVYAGHVGQRAVTLYLVDEASPCGGVHRLVRAMYRYDGVSKWLMLRATRDSRHLSLVESVPGTGITGAMLLRADGDRLEGRWLSPDGERLLPVSLRSSRPGASELERYADALERVEHDHDDC